MGRPIPLEEGFCLSAWSFLSLERLSHALRLQAFGVSSCDDFGALFLGFDFPSTRLDAAHRASGRSAVCCCSLEVWAFRSLLRPFSLGDALTAELRVAQLLCVAASSFSTSHSGP